MRTADADVVVTFVDVLLLLLPAYQMRCVALALREHLNVINLHPVFEILRRSPRINVASAVVNIQLGDARQIAVVNLTLKH